MENIGQAPGSPSNTVKVRVDEVKSITDPETGKPGKRITLVQVRQRTQQPYFSGYSGGGEEATMIRNMMSQIQSMGLIPMGGGMTMPKVNLFLSEGEYDILGIRFEVNEVYDMVLKDGAIRFSKSLDGV
ncbi:MAG: arcadin 1 [Nitrososphaerales archaeon]